MSSHSITAPDGGAFTTLVNPARAATVVTSQKGRSHMAELQKIPGSAPRRRRRNPGGALKSLVTLLLPAAAGGAVAYLEAKPAENKWWHELDDGIKAIVFAGVAYVAKSKNMLEAAGAAGTWAGFYAMRKGIAYMAERDAASPAPPGGKQRPGVGFGVRGLMEEQGLRPADVDAALADAIARAEARSPAGDVQGIAYEGVPSDMATMAFTVAHN